MKRRHVDKRKKLVRDTHMDVFEKRLLKMAEKGDRQAFAELVDLYKDKVYSLAYRMLGNAQDAEDIAQETFMRVYANLHRFDDQYKISTWIYRIANNLCIDIIRKRKVRRHQFSFDAEITGTDGLDLYDTVHDNDPSPEQQLITSELQNKVKDAILSLAPKYRTIMILKYIEDLSLQEISDIVGLPVATVKTRVHRGREALRKKLRSL